MQFETKLCSSYLNFCGANLHVRSRVLHSSTTTTSMEQQQPTASTPKRTPNWSKEEVALLLELVKERKDIIKGKLSPTLSTKDKRRAWCEIVTLLNSAFLLLRRTREQAEKKRQNLLTKAKEDVNCALMLW